MGGDMRPRGACLRICKCVAVCHTFRACIPRLLPLPFLRLQAKLAVLGTLGPGRAGAALVAAHAASRWTALPLTYCCHYLQDAEDAKRGLYNWWEGKEATWGQCTVCGLACAVSSTASRTVCAGFALHHSLHIAGCQLHNRAPCPCP